MNNTIDPCDPLLLKNQLCFPLYACSKEVIRRYRPLLDELDLTYTQYIAMMVMWERQSLNVKELGEELYLDSGTLTPVVKALEQKGYVDRQRSGKDERVVIVRLTDKGRQLKERAAAVPERMAGCVCLPPEKAAMLYELLYEVLGNLSGQNK
jgi:DNA-binding MarR family transcriptional regulator